MAISIRVLLVEDHAVVREGVAALIGLRSDMTVCGQADNGVDAVQLYRDMRPDVLLLDLALPRMDGNDVIRAVRGEFPHARILVLTTYDHDEAIYQALHNGARGYILKTASAETLFAAILHVHAGGRWLAGGMGQRAAAGLGEEHLTGREVELLGLLARGLRNDEISTALSISENTVKSHLVSIYRKLEVGNRTEALAEAVRRGLVRLD